MIFYVEWIWNYGGIRSGGRFKVVWGFQNHQLQTKSVFETPKPPEIDPQTEFHHNSKFIRHKQTCPTSQHPPNPPKTFKLHLKITKNIQNLPKCDSAQRNQGALKGNQGALKGNTGLLLYSPAGKKDVGNKRRSVLVGRCAQNKC